MNSSPVQINVLQKKNLKRKLPSCSNNYSRTKNNNNNRYHQDGHENRGHHHGSNSNPKRHFSWIRFLKFSFALNLVQILRLKCSVQVQYPAKTQVSYVILLIPRLCKQTVKSTFRLIASPLRPQSTSDSSWNTKFSDLMHDVRRQDTSENGSKRAKLMRFARYLRNFRPPLLPLLYLLFGPALFAYKSVRYSRHSQTSLRLLRKTAPWQVKCYRMMPLKSLSIAWGFVNSLHLPIFLRPIVLTWYVKAFHCDLSEAEEEDLKYYKNLGEFFRRSLKHGIRPIDALTPIVSPADGTVLHFGKVDNGIIEQVKGVAYSLSQFLGPPTWDKAIGTLGDPADCEEYTSKILHNSEGTSLFHCVIYLAPGDYHRFHSPVEWTANFRRHFAGELLSVNPTVVKFISGLFSLNERAAYTGQWKHGFFSLTAVGATNVGSIRVYDDPELHTNARCQTKGEHNDKVFENCLHLRKGENFGEFNLGSTIVLIFEAPSNFRFGLNRGMHVKVGETLISDSWGSK